MLGSVLVRSDQWLKVQDQLIQFRSRLSKETGFRMRYELHASEMMSGGGKWTALGIHVRKRHGIFKAALRELAGLEPVVKVMAFVVDSKSPKLMTSPREKAWELLLQRLERFSFNETSTCLLIHDEGNNKSIRSMCRRQRRFGYAPAAYGGPARKVPFDRLLDDPVPRNSKESYLVQWTDLVAHAAFRKVLPWPTTPKDLWDQLGECPNGEANRIERERGSKELPGLITWPSRGFEG